MPNLKDHYLNDHKHSLSLNKLAFFIYSSKLKLIKQLSGSIINIILLINITYSNILQYLIKRRKNGSIPKLGP